MKEKQLTQRAITALCQAGYPTLSHGAIIRLTNFAAQNSGIEWRNYFTSPHDRAGIECFHRDSREIAGHWTEFRRLLKLARSEGVIDADVINVAPHAFSGRLSWNKDHWDYCTGQYYCTEYRRAAIAVLDQAITAVRRARPRQRAEIRTIQQLKDLNARNGDCWFSRGSMGFFGTWIESGIIHGRYFVTSEQPPHGDRMFTVRSFDSTGAIDTVGEFCGHATKDAARDAVPSDGNERAQK